MHSYTWLIFHNIFYLFHIQYTLKDDYLAARCLCSRCFWSSTWKRLQQHKRQKNRCLKYIVYETSKNIMKYQLYMNALKKNRWLFVVISEWFIYDPWRILQLSHLYERYVLRYESFLTTQQIEVRLVAITIE